MPIAATEKRRRWFKRFLPTTLFYRALLILLVPVVVLQLLVAYVFYERHWDSVVRNMANSTAADIAMLTDEFHDLSTRLGPVEAMHQTIDRGKLIDVRVRYFAGPEHLLRGSMGRNKFPDFYDNLLEHVHVPLRIVGVDEDTIRVQVNAPAGLLDFEFSRKRLASSTTLIFIFWMVGSALLLTTIAVLFLRNQVRPIVQLARAAEQFGMGVEPDAFTPRGASEVRRAGRAFLIMAERITRAVQGRSEMLAGISHDLRTPLTRMTLELEMAKLPRSIHDALNADIDEMRRMIDEYLDFARGDSGEPSETVPLTPLLESIVKSYRRQKLKVALLPGPDITLVLRPHAIRRALVNVIDNALRYGGGQVRVAVELSQAYARIKVTDSGPGIPLAQQEEVFKPFTRLEPSRNVETGGVGLGLSIARSVAQAHGGQITLENQYNDLGEVMGLEVTLRLPREVQG